MSALLAAGIVTSLVATIAALSRSPRRSRPGLGPDLRRTTFEVAGAAVLALIGGLVAYAWSGGNLKRAEEVLVLLLVGCLIWHPATRRWNARAHLCWSATFFLFVTYLVFMLRWTFLSPLGGWGMVGALCLWALEVVAAVLGCAYLWEMCDAVGSEHWPRRSLLGVTEPPPTTRRPFVSLHVPAHEEPPELVIATLRSLLDLDYDHYEIVVIDDNTSDESLWRPVESWCVRHGLKFAHLDHWPGYKSGALNFALRELTDPRAEVVGIVDADYQLDPRFLARLAPLFADPALGFVQSPQDYRHWDVSAFHRRLYRSYQYFFEVSQPSRNERNGAIFAGTMGLIRRTALDELGGWDEWCITEDAELSLRLLEAGWSGRHVDASYGWGVMPLTFEAFKGQRFRWCFGGIQILRMHLRSMLPGGGRGARRLTPAQRWSYLSGALQWYGDLLAVLFFFFLLGGALNIALDGGLLFRKLSLFLVGAIPVLVLLGVARGVALVRRGTGSTWGEALGALVIWQSTSLVVARASVQALWARKAEFLRTPKDEDHAHVWRAVTANLPETLFAVLGLLGIAAALTHVGQPAGVLTTLLLLFPTASFAAAPLNSLAARRAVMPDDGDQGMGDQTADDLRAVRAEG